MPPRDRLTRRQALTRGGLALLGMASGATGVRLAAAGDASRKSPVGPEPGHGGPAAEPVAGPPITTPPATGARLVTLTAAEADLDVGGRVVRTWAYGQAAPGPLLRGNRGEVLEVRLRNRLPDPTTIHWHGMAVPWDQDGVPDLPAAAIAPGHDGAYLFNGRRAAAPATLRALPRQRARIRLVNVAADTAFRVALGGHRLTVTHSDGSPVNPVTVDTVLLAMGERYDLEVTLGDGAFPLVAVAEGKGGQGMAVVRTAAGATPPARAHPGELRRRLLRMSDLRAAETVALPDRHPDRAHDVVLEGDMMQWRWTINGHGGGDMAELPASRGERLRLRFVNLSSMFHPMHVHGHTFQVRDGSGRGPRKDTVIVLPLETVVADLEADNPGRWLTHCHNLYHSESGMMAVLDYPA